MRIHQFFDVVVGSGSFRSPHTSMIARNDTHARQFCEWPEGDATTTQTPLTSGSYS
ncbi:hypothetical protein [Nocardia barduliensis]|uniref:hypothetical protein n=1 Tax=Nocardia barduliensis TaxID=2736643 RepID=UPI001573CD3E|nr:hypothetical protein [Nocardia barduliensis]